MFPLLAAVTNQGLHAHIYESPLPATYTRIWPDLAHPSANK